MLNLLNIHKYQQSNQQQSGQLSANRSQNTSNLVKLDKNNSQQNLRLDTNSNVLEELDLIQRTLTVQSIQKRMIDIPPQNTKILQPMFIQEDRVTSAHHNQQLIKKLSAPIRPTSGENFKYGFSDKFYIPRNIQENQFQLSQEKVSQFFNLGADSEFQTSFVVSQPQTALNNPRKHNIQFQAEQNNEADDMHNFEKPKTAAEGHNPRKMNKHKSEVNSQAFHYLNQIQDYRDIVKEAGKDQLDQQENMSFERAKTALNLKRQQMGLASNKINPHLSDGEDEENDENLNESQQMAQQIREQIENNDFEIYTVNDDVRKHMKKFLRPVSQMSGAHLLSSQMLNSIRPTTSHTTLNSPHQLLEHGGDKSQRVNNYLESITIENSQWQTSGLQTRSSQGTRKSNRAMKNKKGSMVDRDDGLLEDFQQSTRKPKSSNFPTRAMKVQSQLESGDYQNSHMKETLEIDTNFMGTTNNQTASKQDTDNLLSPTMKMDDDDEQMKSDFINPSAMQKGKSVGHIKKVGSVKFDVRIKTNNISHQATGSHGPGNNQSMQNLIGGLHNTSTSTLQNNFLSQNSPRNLNENQQIKVVIEDEKEQELGLDIKRDQLSKDQYKYILQKREEITHDLQPFIEQNMRELMDKIQQKNNITLDEDDFQSKSKLIEDTIPIELCQEPIQKNENNRGFFEKPEIEQVTNEVQENFKEVNDKFNRYQIEDQKMNQQNADKRLVEYDFLSPDTHPNCLTEKEMHFILRQFQQPNDQRNYDSLDDVVKQLEFFGKYTQGTRIYLMRLAQLEFRKSQEIIFNQGDEGELMYVILKGGCHVRIQSIKDDGRVVNPVIVSIYDGVQFGELAFMNQAPVTKGLAAVKQIKSFQDFRQAAAEQEIINQAERQKELLKEDEKHERKNEDFDAMLSQVNQSSGQRAATIQTCQDTYLLTISRQHFKNIILNLMQKELDSKLRLLITIPFLDYPTSMPIIPLANMIQTREYALGEIILKEGTVSDEFFIVSKGRCKMVKQEIIVRHKAHLGAKKFKQKPPMKFGMNDCKKLIDNLIKFLLLKKVDLNNREKKKDKIVIKQNQDVMNEVQEEIEEEMKRKPGHYEKIGEDKQNIAYRYQYEMGNFVRGEFFMGRAILQIGIQLDPSLRQKLTCDPNQASRLTVIADAHNTEVFILKNSQIPLFSMELRNQILEGLIVKGQFDSVYTNQLSEWIKNWDHFKVDLIKQAMTRKEMKRR